ncbi:MAG: DUF1501 domain-containing protein [Planctomycetaceae bacterium]
MRPDPIDSFRYADGRRHLLRCGAGLAVAGTSLSPWMTARLTAATRDRAASRPAGRKAKSVVLVYLLGGPPHQDMFDLKPAAAAEVRGPFQPTATAVPGMEICELLPQLAKGAERFSLIRSVSRRNSNHTPMIYYTLTGRETAQPLADNDIRPPQRTDAPHLGAVLAKLMPPSQVLPHYIAIPEVAIRSSLSGEFKRARSPLRGGGAGFLGPQFEALAINGVPGSSDAIPALTLPPEVSAARFEKRTQLLSLLDHRLTSSAAAHVSDTLKQQAVMLTGAAHFQGQPVFSLDDEPAAVRERYGSHRFGRTMLLARRLAEAEVPMIAVHFNEMTICDGWDTHSNNFEALKSELLPMLDQGLSALMDDLDERGLLDQTLIICLGEFGRTPKINGNAGRDHWGDCSSALLAGGGVRGGIVLGESDNIAAYPVSQLVDPVDIHATMYHCLGIDPESIIHDQLQRPWPICMGRVIDELL